jgi:hypothetical protein
MSFAIDVSALTYQQFVITGDPVGGTYEANVDLQLGPGTYGFQLTTTDVNFVFSVTAEGTIDYDAAFDTSNGGFLQGQGTSTLTLVGYPVVLDATALDHDLLVGTIPPDLSRTTTHQLCLLPGTYQCISSSAVVASFYFTLDLAGFLSMPADFDGFASVDNGTQTVTIKGYAITIDGTLLTHDLYPQLLGVSPHLTPDATQTLTIIPAEAYAMVVDSGIVGDFRYSVGTDGTVAYPGSCQGFLGGMGTSTLVLYGYPVVIDTTHAGTTDAVVSIVKPHVTRRFALQVLVPATWAVETSDGVFWSLMLDQEGNLQFDPGQAKSYAVGSVPRLGLVAQ